MAVTLIYGPAQTQRKVERADALLARFAEADDGRGALYYDLPVVRSDRVDANDLGVTLLMNSRADGRAFQTLVREAGVIDLSGLPTVTLEQTSADERGRVADLIAQMAGWRAFGASLATKLLHKKRPALIPILDNQAVFGAYMNARWPLDRSRTETIKDRDTIRKALDWIANDLASDANSEAWRKLAVARAAWTRVEIWDAVWWAYFRENEPARPAGPNARFD
ncbi:MAG: DUF6308 family protein [Chloroflexota bacterium]|nr:DUF6308 family protein [Chloroflexota bacterium]